MIQLITNMQIGWIVTIFLLLAVVSIAYAISTATPDPNEIIHSEEDKLEAKIDEIKPSEGQKVLTEHIMSVVEKAPKEVKKLTPDEIKDLGRIKQRYNRKTKKE
jgi:hypothetical protein